MGNKNSDEQQILHQNARSFEVPGSEIGASIQSFTAKFNDDKLHTICDYVLKDSPSAIIISFSYRDQGWGNCKVCCCVVAY